MSSSKPTIAVFFGNPDPLGYPFNKDMYMNSYRQFEERVAHHGGDLVVVRGQDSYLGNGRFSKGWRITNDPFEELENVQADVIFDRSVFSHDDTVTRFNHKDLHYLCTDKAHTYATYPDFSPISYTAETREEMQQAVDKLETERIVVKPFDGAEGKDVMIMDRLGATAQTFTPTKKVIVQEFLDLEAGIPGIVEGLHDLRVGILNGEIVYSFVRTPPEGSYTANVAQGGALIPVPVKDLPQDIREVVDHIDADLNHHQHRYYCIDFGITPQGPKIIEMNSRAAIFPNEMAEDFVAFKDKLAHTLVRIARG